MDSSQLYPARPTAITINLTEEEITKLPLLKRISWKKMFLAEIINCYEWLFVRLNFCSLPSFPVLFFVAAMINYLGAFITRVQILVANKLEMRTPEQVM